MCTCIQNSNYEGKAGMNYFLLCGEEWNEIFRALPITRERTHMKETLANMKAVATHVLDEWKKPLNQQFTLQRAKAA